MIAYKKSWLDNLLIEATCKKAYHQHSITETEWKHIQQAHPVGFYTPNFFIRCGLFLLTLIIGLFTFGLISLVFIAQIDDAVPVISLLTGAISFLALEIMVRTKNHYRSGVTEALIWITIGAVFAGISTRFNFNELANCILLYLLCAFFSIRYLDVVSSIATFLSFLATLLYASILLGNTTKSLSPFLLIGASCVTYVVIKQLDFRNKLRFYRSCMQAVELCSLLTLYAAGNYFVIQQLNANLLVEDIAPVTHIPFSWIFWISTCIIPPAYIVVGLIKKDKMLYRAGLILLLALVFTIDTYYSLAPIEILLAIAGVSLIVVAWFFIRLLQKPRFGYTFTKEHEKDFAISQIESIVIAETLSGGGQHNEETSFEGGSFGGAGGGGEY